MNLNVTIYDSKNDTVSILPISKIEPLRIFSGVLNKRLALGSNVFVAYKKYIQSFKDTFDNPFEGTPINDNFLFVNDVNFFIFETTTGDIVKKGIIDNHGKVLVFDSFDNAMPMSEDFILLEYKGLYGFVNCRTAETSAIEYESINMQPILSIDEQDAEIKLAAIVSKTINYLNRKGALSQHGKILLPLKYDWIEYKGNNVEIRQFSQFATVPIADLGNSLDFQFSEKHQVREDFDPDPWGAKAEMDYIRQNGGDWIDD